MAAGRGSGIVSDRRLAIHPVAGIETTGKTMADFRNALAKAIRDAEHKAFMEKHYPSKAGPVPARCLCGHAYLDVPRMWQIDEPGWPRKTGIYCPACIPPHLIGWVADDAANLPHDEDGGT